MELQPILEAIEVLLARRDLTAADELYRGRLVNGKVFQNIPAPQEGLRCTREFLEPPEIRAVLEHALGKGRVAIYLRGVALFGSILGEMEGVECSIQELIAIAHAEQSWVFVNVGYQGLTDSQALRGTLAEAIGSASEALFYAGIDEAGTSETATGEGGSASGERESAKGHRVPPAQAKATASRCAPNRPSSVPAHDVELEVVSRALRAHALSLAGELSAASRDFAAADALNRKNGPDNDSLYSIWGVQWCRHRLRLGETDSACRLTEANRTICERYHWNADLARCDILLGEFDLEAGNLDSSARHIGTAVRILREARQGKDLPDALLVQARLRGNIEDCEEALRLAARSGFALKECEALNLRARLRCEVGQPADGAKDARVAYDIAERCGYYWGRHEALRQLRAAAQALGNRADTQHWDEAEKALAANMKPEIEEALRINREHDKAMKKLYGKKA